MSTTHAITTTTSSEVSECPEGWTHHETSCYWVVLYPVVNWFEAFNGCPQLHPAAHLASSGSESENEIISSLHSDSVYLWLGGTDADEEGNWIWTDGTPFNYTRWYSGEGAGGITQNCLALYTNYEQWYDYECFESYPYVCEINLDYK